MGFLQPCAAVVAAAALPQQLVNLDDSRDLQAALTLTLTSGGFSPRCSSCVENFN